MKGKQKLTNSYNFNNQTTAFRAKGGKTISYYNVPPVVLV